MIVTIVDEDTTLVIQLIRKALPSSITYWTAYHQRQWISTSEL
jgi:hypothetical protein